MTQTADAGDQSVSAPGLASRLAGVIFSPYRTYAAVAARPRAFGALAVSLTILVGTQTWFASTAVGQQALLEQQVQTMEALGMTVTDETYAQLEQAMSRSAYFVAVNLVVGVPLGNAVVAGLMLGVFTALMGGQASFRHAFAVSAHASFIPAALSLVTTPLNYARADMSSPFRLVAFAPMLDDESAAAMFLSGLDLVWIWWTVNLAIGIGVLYRRRTTPIVWSLLIVYLVVVGVITAVRVAF